MTSPEEVREWVEREYEKYPWLPRAKHVLVILDRIYYDDLSRGVRVYFSGLQPGWRSDTIIISWPARKPDTLVHETLHMLGLGERGAWALAPRIVALRSRIHPLVRRRPHYRICSGGPGCPYRELHRMLGPKLVHLVLS